MDLPERSVIQGIRVRQGTSGHTDSQVSWDSKGSKGQLVQRVFMGNRVVAEKAEPQDSQDPRDQQDWHKDLQVPLVLQDHLVQPTVHQVTRVLQDRRVETAILEQQVSLDGLERKVYKEESELLDCPV
jgi:hypothetical protein